MCRENRVGKEIREGCQWEKNMVLNRRVKEGHREMWFKKRTPGRWELPVQRPWGKSTWHTEGQQRAPCGLCRGNRLEDLKGLSHRSRAGLSTLYKALWGIVKMLAFTLNEVGSHWKILNADAACVLSRFSRVQLFVTTWTVVHQAPLSMGFSRQEYWSGLPCSPLGDLPDPGLEPVS